MCLRRRGSACPERPNAPCPVPSPGPRSGSHRTAAVHSLWEARALGYDLLPDLVLTTVGTSPVCDESLELSRGGGSDCEGCRPGGNGWAGPPRWRRWRLVQGGGTSHPKEEGRFLPPASSRFPWSGGEERGVAAWGECRSGPRPASTPNGGTKQASSPERRKARRCPTHAFGGGCPPAPRCLPFRRSGGGKEGTLRSPQSLWPPRTSRGGERR